MWKTCEAMTSEPGQDSGPVWRTAWSPNASPRTERINSLTRWVTKNHKWHHRNRQTLLAQGESISYCSVHRCFVIFRHPFLPGHPSCLLIALQIEKVVPTGHLLRPRYRLERSSLSHERPETWKRCCTCSMMEQHLRESKRLGMQLPALTRYLAKRIPRWRTTNRRSCRN